MSIYLSAVTYGQQFDSITEPDGSGWNRFIMADQHLISLPYLKIP